MAITVNGFDCSAVFGPSGSLPGARIWVGVATTTSSGAWSVSFAAAGFTAPPNVQVTAQSADATATNAAYASLNGPATTVAAASGIVVVPNTIAVGGLPVKAASAGIIVNVLAIGT